MHHDRPFVSEIPRIRKFVEKEGLVGLANDTKWNELISWARHLQDEGWSPAFRYSCIDSDYISGWDGEWYHHLPYPMISVNWIDLTFLEEVYVARLLPSKVINHREELENKLRDIRFDYVVGEKTIRVFGYAPRVREYFEN